MRIALVHSYYATSQPSGETLAVDYQADALRRAGHEVLVVARYTDQEALKRSYPLRAAVVVATGRGYDPTAELLRFDPDVVHVHNWFPNIGTSWLRRWSGPVVATLHNFRPMCAAGTLFRDGATCTLCPDRSSFHAVRHACYRSSAAATLPLAIRTRGGALGDPVLNRADKVVCLSTRSANIYRNYGVPKSKIEIVPNFVRTPPATAAPQGRGWLFAGRLAVEKGIVELLEIWPESERLDIAGAGPLEEQVTRRAQGRIRYLGRLTSDELFNQMGSYEGVVIPSLWAEGATTNVLLESLKAGCPVIAARGSAAADEVVGLSVGAVYDAHDAQQLVTAMAEVRGTAGLRERCLYMSGRFSESAWLDRTENLYHRLIAECRS